MVFPELLLNQQNLRLSLYPPSPLYKSTQGLCVFLQGGEHTRAEGASWNAVSCLWLLSQSFFLQGGHWPV